MKKVKRKKPPIINNWLMFWYTSRQNFWIKVALACSPAPLVKLGFGWSGSRLPEWVLIASLIFSVVILLLTFRLHYQRLIDSDLTPAPIPVAEFEHFLATVKLPKELECSGFEVLHGGRGKRIADGIQFRAASAVSRQLNQVLWQISLQPDFSFNTSIRSDWQILPILFGRYRAWRLPKQARDLIFPTIHSCQNGAVLVNEKKIRLREDLLQFSCGSPLVIERTDYLSDPVTGQITGVRFIDHEKHPYYNGYDLPYEYKSDGWYLKTCQASACSNQLGVSSLCIAISAIEDETSFVLQGHVFIVVQGEGNFQSPGLLAPSGSGSLDWSDYEEFGGQFVAEGMRRELLEETLKGDGEALLARGGPRVLLTGFGRMLHRGGKPEFYGLVLMPRRGDERGIDPTEKFFVAGFESIEVNPLTATTLHTQLKAYREANAARLSHPLFLSLLFAEEFLQGSGRQFDQIVTEVGEYWRGSVPD